MMADEARLRLSEDVSFQSLGPGQETVVLSLATGYFYTCNDTCTAFLELVDGSRPFSEVVELVWAKFDAPREVLRRDLATLAETLMQEGLMDHLGEA